MSIPKFLDFIKERDQLDEAFNSAPYELTMGKKNAGDVFFTFIDEDDKEYRIQFYTPQGLGKNVRQVFIGQKRGSVYPDAIARFKNPMRVIASMIEATKQFMATPLGKTIDGYAVNFSKKALDRGMTLIPKIIRQSGLKQKLNVMDLTYAPVPDRGYVWLVKKGKDPAQVFDGPKMQGITWDDPDKIGDVPDQSARDAALQGDIDDLSQTINTQKSGWYNEVAPAGNPSIGWYNKQGTYNGGIGLRFAAIYGVYSGSSVAVNFKEIEGKDVDALARKLKLPPIPKQVSSKFVASAEAWWKQKNVLPPNTTSQGSTEQNVSSPASIKNGVAQHMTSQDMDNHPFRLKVLSMIDAAVQKEGIATPGGSKGFYKFTNGGTFRVYFDRVQNDTFFGSLATDAGLVEIKSPFNADYVAGDFLSAIRKAAAARRDKSWDVMVDEYKNILKAPVAKTDTTAVGNAIFIDGFKIISALARKSDFIVLNLDIYDPNGNQVNLPITVRSIDVDENKPKDLKSLFNASVKNALEVAKRSSDFSNPNPNSNSNGPDLTTDRWRALSNAFFKVKDIHGVASRTSTYGSIVFGGKGAVVVTMNRGVRVQDDPVFVTVKAVSELGPKGQDIGKPIVIRNIDITKPSKLTPQIQTAVDQLAPLVKPNGRKTAEELAAYGESIRESAPSTRDIDWEVYASRDGETMAVGWTLTFRRNTSEGAYLEYKGQIDRANQYLKSVYDDAKSKGYIPSEPRYATLEMAKRADEITFRNEGSAYSEYEQSLGGRMEISIS